MEEAVTSELFSGEDGEKERNGEGDEDGRETCETVILAIRQVLRRWFREKKCRERGT